LTLKHVLHIVENLDRGGMETFVCDLIEAQLKTFKISVICIFGGGVLSKRLENLGVMPQFCNKAKDGSITALWRLRANVNALAPDIIHTHNELSNYFTAVALAMSAQPILINTRHNMGLGGPKSRKERFFRWSMSKTKAMVACSDAVKARFVSDFQFPIEKIRVIHNGIPVSNIQKITKNTHNNWRRQHGFNDSDILVCAVGRHAEVKNHRSLVRAFAMIKLTNTFLILVGDGPLRKDLQLLVENLDMQTRVRFVGDSSEVSSILASVDIFVLPSLSEAHSIALLEAAAAGLAIVATNVGGNPEVIDHGINGFIVEPGNIEELTNRIAQLIDCPAIRAEFGKRSFSWANANASIEVCANSYAKLYKEVLSI
jgi:glycosyltransferase involved in cell wall biosynthesis